jgi:hypothetical protein
MSQERSWRLRLMPSLSTIVGTEINIPSSHNEDLNLLVEKLLGWGKIVGVGKKCWICWWKNFYPSGKVWVDVYRGEKGANVASDKEGSDVCPSKATISCAR